MFQSTLICDRCKKSYTEPKEHAFLWNYIESTISDALTPIKHPIPNGWLLCQTCHNAVLKIISNP